MKRTPPAETLIQNLNMLMAKTNTTSAYIAQKSGVSKRMIDYILKGERKPTIDIAESIASAYGITGWQIIMPSLPYDLVKSGKIDKLLDDFTHCDAASQKYISHVAERDAVYKVSEQ